MQYCLILILMLSLVGCQRTNTEDDQAEQAQAENGDEPASFSELEWKIVEKNQALAENPNLIEVQNDTNASDPISGATQAYFSAISKLNQAQMEHNAVLQSQIDAIDSNQNPTPPTFEEFNAQMKMNPNNIKGLKPWQVYAYDEKTGKVCILEDREERNRLREEQGLDPIKDE